MRQLSDWLRKPLAKVLTRAVLYGLAAVFGWCGIEAAEAEAPAAMIGEGLAAAVLLVAAAMLDRWHHRKDTAAGGDA